MKDKEKQIRFSVIDNKTGEYPDLYNIALKEDWAKGLLYCDMEGFSINEDGQLILSDDCGKFVYCPGDRFTVVFEDSVVLSREEYEKLKSLYDNQKGAYMTSNIGDLPLTVEGLRKAVDEITRLNRVESELQELNAKYYNEAKDLRRELKQSHKEMAEKILKDFKLWAREYQNKDTVIDDYGERPMTNNEKLNYLYTYLCDKYKVEIKE